MVWVLWKYCFSVSEIFKAEWPFSYIVLIEIDWYNESNLASVWNEIVPVTI